VDFPQLLTEAEAAEFLGVPVEVIALWAREGKLPAAARTEGGQLLFYRWRVERDGAALAAFAPIRTKARSMPQPRPAGSALVCGCRLTPPPGRLCRIGAGLLASASLAESLVVGAPGDPLLTKLADLCRDALTRHLTGPVADGSVSMSAPRLAPEVVAAVERLEGRSPDQAGNAGSPGTGPTDRTIRNLKRVIPLSC
jgi:hypothetical protein